MTWTKSKISNHTIRWTIQAKTYSYFKTFQVAQLSYVRRCSYLWHILCKVDSIGKIMISTTWVFSGNPGAQVQGAASQWLLWKKHLEGSNFPRFMMIMRDPRLPCRTPELGVSLAVLWNLLAEMISGGRESGLWMGRNISAMEDMLVGRQWDLFCSQHPAPQVPPLKSDAFQTEQRLQEAQKQLHQLPMCEDGSGINKLWK